MLVRRNHQVSSMGWLLLLVVSVAALHQTEGTDYASDPTVLLLQEYIRLNTTTGNNLTSAVEFWQGLAAEEGLPVNVYTYCEGYPVVVIKWAGSDSSARSIMLNSHMDVVPADESDGWDYAPFEGKLADDGNIYGRGTQDMKSVSIQYFQALRQLVASGEEFVRNVYMSFMPDEEIGGSCGMIPFLESDEFAAMNVGFEMDEGSSYPLPMIPLFYQDKVVWQIQVDCYGVATHGSSFSDTNSTATGKCNNFINTMFEFRDEQYEIYLNATIYDAGIYTSVNLNELEGGTAHNIVPSHVWLVFDIRLCTKLNITTFEEQLEKWATEADVNITYIVQNEQSPATLVSSDNPYLVAINNAASEVGITILPVIPAGSTDARHVRNAGYPAFGFSPMPNTNMLLHAVNEYVHAGTLIDGVTVYKHFISNLANIPAEETTSEPSTLLYTTIQ